MKKILFLSIIILIIFIIYITNQDKKIYYLSLGDGLALSLNSNKEKDYGYTEYITDYLKQNKKLEKIVNNFNTTNMRVIDLINKIGNNEEEQINNKKITIQNALIKADLVTISIGNNDLISKLSMSNIYTDDEIYKYIDDYILDLDKLLNQIRNYCKEQIIFIGYYNILNNIDLDKYYKYLIKQTNTICNKYKVNYLDIYDLNSNNNFYPTKEQYTYIGKKLVKTLVK